MTSGERTKDKSAENIYSDTNMNKIPEKSSSSKGSVMRNENIRKSLE